MGTAGLVAQLPAQEDEKVEREHGWKHTALYPYFRSEGPLSYVKVCFLDKNETALLDASEALSTERQAWTAARIADFKADYAKAVAQFAALLRKGAARGDALGAYSLSQAMRSAKLYDPEDRLAEVIEMRPQRLDTVSRTWTEYPVWEDDPAAKAVYGPNVYVRETAENLERQAQAIRRSREEAARTEASAAVRGWQPPEDGYHVEYAAEYSQVPVVEVKRAGR